MSAELVNKRILSANSASESCFIILLSILWASGLFGFVFVAADKILNTDVFFRSTGKIILCVILALGSINYLKNIIKPIDLGVVTLFLFLYFFAPSSKYIPILEYENYTNAFLWALPMYLIGVSIDFVKTKELLHILSLLGIVVGSYYNLVYIHAVGYKGSVEFSTDNMSASYGILLNVIFMLWYCFEHFSYTKIITWVDIAVTLLGCFAILMLGTRGPIICIIIFTLLYLIFAKTHKHRILYLMLLFGIIYIIVSNFEYLMLSLLSYSEQLGFSTRIFDFFLSGENIFAEGSSGRDAFYPILFEALADSPYVGYGFFGSYQFINTYPHNIFMEIMISFGYLLGGSIILYGLYVTIKAIIKTYHPDNKGFLYVLIGSGVISLLFSSMFIVTPAFYMFIGYSVQLAYRKDILYERQNQIFLP